MKKVLLLLFAGLCLTAAEAAAQKNVLVPYRKGDKWGYCRLNKSIVIAPKYDDASPFSEYDDEKDRYAARAIAQVTKAGKEIYINTAGKEVEWSEGADDSGLDVGELIDNDSELKVEYVNGKAGLVKGIEIIFEHRFDSIRLGLAPSKYVFVKIGGDWGVMATDGEHKGKWLVPGIFDEVSDMLTAVPYFVVKKDGKSGVWGERRELLQPEHTEVALVGAITHFCAIATIERDGVRLFSLGGERLNDEVYEDILRRVDVLGSHVKGYDKLLYVRKNGKWGLVNDTGKNVTPFRYEELMPFRAWPFTTVLYKGKVGYIGVDGTEYFED